MSSAGIKEEAYKHLQEIGLAMIHSVNVGYESPILGSREIAALAQKV
ncbi:hypothetical protein [Paenibacillus monticola]|nr:hypothetical protein [Paenibacillus monticola]